MKRGVKNMTLEEKERFQKDIFNLRKKGLTFIEIAKKLKCSEATVAKYFGPKDYKYSTKKVSIQSPSCGLRSKNMSSEAIDSIYYKQQARYEDYPEMIWR